VRILLVIVFFLTAQPSNDFFAEWNDDYVYYFYNHFELDCKGLDYHVYETAMKGYVALRAEGKLIKKDIVSIIDYELPSTEPRFWILNLKTGEVTKKLHVAHGRNTGLNYARAFSNIDGSKQSSLGFYVTAETYSGQHGYSLRLNGQERGWNNNARRRAIVIHGADYVSNDIVDSYGRLGRSWGCPALSYDVCPEVIDIIKNGSCLFIYGGNKKYEKSSPILCKANADLSV